MIKEKNRPKEETTWKAFWSDVVDQWLAVRCVHGSAARCHKTGASVLHRDFVAWCAERDYPELSIRMFGDLLRYRGITYAGKDGGGRVMRWPVRLATEAEVSASSPAGAQSSAAEFDMVRTRRAASLSTNAVRAAFAPLTNQSDLTDGR